MTPERKIAQELWPAHAELLSDHDWSVLTQAVAADRPLREAIVEPLGEAKDAFLASLMIIYWTMKLAHIALQIKEDVTNLHGREKAAAILAGSLSRIDDTTPKRVVERAEEILKNLNIV
jgi:hypothetical protein